MANAEFTFAEILEATQGELYCAGHGSIAPTRSYGISTDSRTLQGGEAFLALRGERFDAHEMLAEIAKQNLAALFLVDDVSRLPAELSIPVIRVVDTLRAYQALGNFHRRRFPEVVVTAVTGSVGKTSVKEMLRAIFTEACHGDASQVLYTLGNTNNQIGVPQNLLRLNSLHRFAVLEMGTNHHGEIAPLSRCALPDVAVVNTIAPCHLEFLGDLNGVAQEKSTIFSGLKPDGCAVYPAQSAGHETLAVAAAHFVRHRTFGMRCPDAEEQPSVAAEYLNGNLFQSQIQLNFADTEEHFVIDWKLSGAHQAANAAAAAAVADACNIPRETICRGLSKTELPGMRMQQSTINGIHFVNDAYNANPASMHAALELLEAFQPKDQLFLILGDMLELGAEEAPSHLALLQEMLNRFGTQNSHLAAVGPRFCAAGQALSEPDRNKIHFFPDSQTASAALSEKIPSGKTVFLKASRGIALEKILTAVQQNSAEPHIPKL